MIAELKGKMALTTQRRTIQLVISGDMSVRKLAYPQAL